MKILFGVIGLLRCCGPCYRQGDVFLSFMFDGVKQNASLGRHTLDNPRRYMYAQVI